MTKQITIFGECMIELRKDNQGEIKQDFAGDVYNAAVYLKRTAPNIKVQMAMCVGHDTFSHQLLEIFNREQIAIDYVTTDTKRHLGLYWIETDDQGERSFTYWRDQSATKRYFADLPEATVQQMCQSSMFLFSGISIAIIDKSSRKTFWQLIERLKQAGVTIVFDPNYRSRLWESMEDTKAQYELAFSHADIIMPSVEDLESIYPISAPSDMIALLKPYQPQLIVVKDGPNSVTIQTPNESHSFPVTRVRNVVDTTSAGDSFNGAFLGALLCEQSLEDAVAIAARTAGIVIQYPGAIIPKHAL